MKCTRILSATWHNYEPNINYKNVLTECQTYTLITK